VDRANLKMSRKKPTYQDLVDHSSLNKEIVKPQVWKYLQECSEFTGEELSKTWISNMKKNLRDFYPKHGSVGRKLLGYGANKAVIGVGAGPSYSLNKDVLSDVFRLNAKFRESEQAFVIIATNHQFKPLLKDKIFPHFVMVVDASKNTRRQLLDIPKFGKETILIASLFTDSVTIRKWDKRGGDICFFVPDGSEARELFESETGDDASLVVVPPAGNVMNMMWLLSGRVLHSNIFMGVGNDLSMKHSQDVKEREESFYADGEIKADIERAQTEKYMGWMGFKFREKNNPFSGQPVVELHSYSTSRQMFQYKLWLEIHVANFHEQKDHNFKYINCSEQGILGVLAHNWEPEVLRKNDPKNFYLMDEVCSSYMTMRLRDAVTMYLEARKWLETQTATRAGVLDIATTENGVIISPEKMGGANVTGPRGRVTESGIILL